MPQPPIRRTLHMMQKGPSTVGPQSSLRGAMLDMYNRGSRQEVHECLSNLCEYAQLGGMQFATGGNDPPRDNDGDRVPCYPAHTGGSESQNASGLVEVNSAEQHAEATGQVTPSPPTRRESGKTLIAEKEG